MGEVYDEEVYLKILSHFWNPWHFLLAMEPILGPKNAIKGS